MIRAGEENAASNHLTHDAAHWPDVDVFLVAHAEDDFWSAIITRDDIRRHHESSAGCTGQAEVENLESAIRLYDDIRRLQILNEGTTRVNLIARQ